MSFLGLHQRNACEIDDTAVYRMISNGHDQLQEDLQWLADWEESWNMEFHLVKCQTLSITRSTKPLQPSYIIHGHTLENVSLGKYPGLTINSTVSWGDHICSKANKVLGFLMHNLISASNIKEKAYKAFVHPQLEHAASAWPLLTEEHCQDWSSLEASGMLHPQQVQVCQQHAGNIGLAYSGAMTPDLLTVSALQNLE